MEERIADLLHIPNLSEFEDVHLLTLREHCAVLEEKVCDILTYLPERDRQIFEAYTDIRNELEFQSVKIALRWGKQHYR